MHPIPTKKLLAKHYKPYRKDVVIATKFGCKDARPAVGLDSRSETIRRIVTEASLKD
ncbi:hypothetical protein [Chryseobacterium sp.]|uniref:hypothetical protein n=1 Tax=Chryseobacterium sp. TaxID=1871047 RepID=UPI00261B27E6|nr:hypothetical protein [Chryseobacterium sp.]